MARDIVEDGRYGIARPIVDAVVFRVAQRVGPGKKPGKPPRVPDGTVGSLLHFEGADGGFVFTDEVPGITWGVAGSAKTSTAVKKFGASSMYTDGNGDYIRTTNITQLGAGGEFTLECFSHPGTMPPSGGFWCLFEAVNASGLGIALYYTLNTAGAPNGTDAFFRLYVSSNGTTFNVANGTYSDSLGAGATFHSQQSHVVLQWNGTHYDVYWRGTRVLRVASALAPCVFTGINLNGNLTAAQSIDGYMDEFRYISDNAVYNGASITVPTAPFTV